METPKPITGPYRATRLWNEAIRIFNNGVPRKKHWRQLRQYENCFTASEATNWLHAQLKANPHFGPSVTKEQTQQLLCKFLKAGVFEDVRGIESKVEHFKDNSGLYRLTNKSPFRNPRTPGRTPLSSVINRANRVDNGSSPKLGKFHHTTQNNIPLNKSALSCAKKLVECQVTARQLSEEEVQDLWKNTTMREISKILGALNLSKFTNISQLKGKWVLWNVTHIGSRGVVQSIEESDSPPSWVLYAMKSLVNWPSNEKHRLPEYHGSEKDVFKVICDYFTNASSPLTTFSLYNLFVEAFIRAEATDLKFRKPQEKSEDNEEEAFSINSKGSVQSLIMKMASPAPHKTSTPLSTCPFVDYYSTHDRFSSLPVVKSPVRLSRSKAQRGSDENAYVSSKNPLIQTANIISSKIRASNFLLQTKTPGKQSYNATSDIPSNTCYETAFTTVEPRTRLVSNVEFTLPRRSHSSDDLLNEEAKKSSSKLVNGLPRSPPNNNSNIYRSLDRLRSKSGGYVNVAAFGSVDCLDRSGVDWCPDGSSDLWTSSVGSMHSRSVSSLNSQRASATGLSPSPVSESSIGSYSVYRDYENYRCIQTDDSPANSRGPLRVYKNSPSKRLIGRRKGLEFYYGAKACRPGLLTPEGKQMAMELLQLLTLLMPPDRRRKLHLLLRFMAKASANEKLVLDREVPLKTLMINTFYRCIVCSPDEADYDELLAVRLVTFLMENAEAIMTVPHQLCATVRDLLINIQREKIRFQPDDTVPLAYCQQVSPRRFERERHNESENAIRQLLEHILNDQKMPLKEKRKRLKQFRIAYPEIYNRKFPLQQPAKAADVKDNIEPTGSSSKQAPVLARIRNLRLL